MNRFLIIFSILFFIAGCSQTDLPITPTDHQYDVTVAEISDDSYVTGTMNLGVWEVAVDLESQEIDYNMVRNASAIGQTIPDALLTTYLQSEPCTTCVRMNVLRFDPIRNRITLSIGIRHPIPAHNPGAPASAMNRADLDVFDPMAIVIMPDNGANFNYLINGDTPVEGDTWTLVNPDAYTHSMHDIICDNIFLNPAYAEPISTLNPLKYYARGEDNRRWRQGSGFEMLEYTFDMRHLVGNALEFYIVFRASYGQSATFAHTIFDEWGVGSRRNPKYYIPEFNMVEAYDITVERTGANITWKDSTSTTQFTVTCKDHQAGLTGIGRYLLESDPDHIISFTSDVERVVLDIPTLSDTPWEETNRTGTGTPGDPYVFNFTVQNNKAASFGTYQYLVAVEDNRSFPPMLDAYQVGCLRIPYIDNFTVHHPVNDTGWTIQTFSGRGWGFVEGDNMFDESGGGNYDDQTSTRLKTPVIDLSCSSANPYMEITHLYRTQMYYDGGSVFASRDGGFSFDYRQPLPILGGKNYDDRIIGSLVPSTVLGGKYGFTGDSGGSVTTQFDLSAYAYESDVVIVFVFESDYYLSDRGWEIREVKIFP